MKCIVTILQNKRVALPHIFNKYSMPVLGQVFNKDEGQLKLFHIFHDTHVPTDGMISNHMEKEHIEKVERAITCGMFPSARIIRNSIVNPRSPHLPSLQKALSVALVEYADFHLWLEDDAIIYDTDCNSWATMLGSGDVGLYQNTDEKQMLNTAYMLSTYEFDVRFAKILQEFDKNKELPNAVKGMWDKYVGKHSLTEHCAWRAARKPVFMGPNKAYRHHPHPTRFRKTVGMVREWLKKTIPSIKSTDLDLLAVDFAD